MTSEERLIPESTRKPGSTSMSKKLYPIGVFLVILVVVTLLVHLSNPYNIWIGTKYLSQLTDMIGEDETREDTRFSSITAEIEHTLHKMQIKYRDNECQGNDNPRYTWLTAMVNDDFIVPNVVMGHMLNKLSCYRKKIAIVGDKVTEEGRNALRAIGFEIMTFPGMNCDNMDLHWGRKPQHTTFIGMHTRLWAFNMTQYDKIVYLDGDFFPLTSLDSIFDMIEEDKLAATYCSKPGVVDPCFNSGMIAFKPKEKVFVELMEFWKQISYYECPDDQRLMWYFFASKGNWIKVPYSYNVRRERYYPMRSFHFAAGGRYPKPWKWADKPTRQEAAELDAPLSSELDVYRLWWKYLYEGFEDYKLWDWWHQSNVYKAFKHSDGLTGTKAVDMW